MKEFEARLLVDAVNIYCKKNKCDDNTKASLINDIKNSALYWAEKYPTKEEADIRFSEHFWGFLNNYLSEKGVRALLLRYDEKMKFEEIGNIEGCSRACIEQRVKQSLMRLLNPRVWKVLLLEEVWVQELNRTVPKDNIFATDISNTVKHRIKYYIDTYNRNNNTELDYTIDTVINTVKSLTDIPRMGLRTANEILRWFNDNGYEEVADRWKNNLNTCRVFAT